MWIIAVLNTKSYCFDVCGYHWCPQTQTEMCRNMGIWCGFRAVATRQKYPGFILSLGLVASQSLHSKRWSHECCDKCNYFWNEMEIQLWCLASVSTDKTFRKQLHENLYFSAITGFPNCCNSKWLLLNLQILICKYQTAHFTMGTTVKRWNIATIGKCNWVNMITFHFTNIAYPKIVLQYECLTLLETKWEYEK